VVIDTCTRRLLTDCDFVVLSFRVEPRVARTTDVDHGWQVVRGSWSHAPPSHPSPPPPQLSPPALPLDQITVTTSHILNVHRKGLGRWVPSPAGTVCIGDMLRIAKGNKATVVEVCPFTEPAEVVEVVLKESMTTFFASTCESSPRGWDAFVEIYGGSALTQNNMSVNIITYKWRPRRFKELLLESPQLEECIKAPKKIDIKIDLAEAGLGPGKFIVAAQLAPRVLSALRLRRERLKAGDIVVSSQYEPIVRQLVSWRNQEVHSEALDLPPKLKVDKTFLGLDEQPTTSLRTQSTLGAYAWDSSRNPRAKASLQKVRAAH